MGCTPLAMGLHLGSSYAALFECARLQGCISGGTVGCGPPLLHPYGTARDAPLKPGTSEQSGIR